MQPDLHTCGFHYLFPVFHYLFSFLFLSLFWCLSKGGDSSTTYLRGRDVSRKYLTMTTAVDYLSSFQESFIISSPPPLLSYLGTQSILPDFFATNYLCRCSYASPNTAEASLPVPTKQITKQTPLNLSDGGLQMARIALSGFLTTPNTRWQNQGLLFCKHQPGSSLWSPEWQKLEKGIM